MRKMETPSESADFGGQMCAIDVVLAYENSPSKADEILSAHFYLSPKYKGYSRICQFIFLTLLRNLSLLNAAIKNFSPRPPRKKLKALLLAAAAECLAGENRRVAQVSHAWVGAAKRLFSPAEAKFANAFLRRFPEFVEGVRRLEDSPENLELKYGCPAWLAKRWIAEFGIGATLEILRLSQRPSRVFFRKSQVPEAEEPFLNFAKFFENSKFENFYALKSGNWEKVSRLLQTPYFYVQDPSTSRGPKMLAPKAGKSYLDLCAAPGGKSRLIADLMLEDFNNSRANASRGFKGALVSVDCGKKRMEMLGENMSKSLLKNAVLVECDLLEESLEEKLVSAGLQTDFDGVFLDAPCSNTGVLRRRPDARWRLSEGDISNCKKIQFEMLKKAARFVRAGGKMLYSTCSIERAENEENIGEFLEAFPEFRLVCGQTFLPEEEADGCGAFLLEKRCEAQIDRGKNSE